MISRVSKFLGGKTLRSGPTRSSPILYAAASVHRALPTPTTPKSYPLTPHQSTSSPPRRHNYIRIHTPTHTHTINASFRAYNIYVQRTRGFRSRHYDFKQMDWTLRKTEHRSNKFVVGLFDKYVSIFFYVCV